MNFAILFGDATTDRVVPSSGVTAQLTLFVSIVMTFLAVFALALAFSAGRLASTWGQGLAASATVRVLSGPDVQQEDTSAALRVLETTAGVTSMRALSDAEQAALLAPWIGADLPLDDLPIPRLITIDIDPERFDAEGLRLRLQGEVPRAILDDHGRWRAPLAAAAVRLRNLGWASGLLIVAVIAAMVTLAANAALSANAQVVRVLRLVGATDHYIAGAFIRRFTIRATSGAILGTGLGLAVLWFLPSEPLPEAPGLLTGFGYRGPEWFVPLILPLLAGSVALLATAAAARNVLKDLA